jgi:hypothetical protein|tara:strand:+ start:276 stop:434 length:159 start_codon:yes stop_codon:yes gene_type:complete
MFELNHYNVSMAKSALRIVAGCFLMGSSFFAAGGLFIIAEVLGIVEEIVEDK